MIFNGFEWLLIGSFRSSGRFAGGPAAHPRAGP